MLSLKAKIRKELRKKVKSLREKGILPGILYGPKLKNQTIEVDLKEFQKVYAETGESLLFELLVDKEKYMVLIHALEIDPLSQAPIHVDFYQPNLEKEIEVTVPLVFEGEPVAVKDLEGTLVRNIQEIEVKALPQNLAHEIKVNVEGLATFEDNILVKDLALPEGVTVSREPDEIVALIVPPEKVEEELAKPVEEEVEGVEKEGEEKKEGEEEAEGEEPKEEKGKKEEK